MNAGNPANGWEIIEDPRVKMRQESHNLSVGAGGLHVQSKNKNPQSTNKNPAIRGGVQSGGVSRTGSH